MTLVPISVMWLALGKLGVPENTIKLIHSFHQGMEARIGLDGALLEEFSVENRLRQGCCMAQVLFNLYTCLAMECWQARVEDVGGVGINLRYNMTTSSSGGTPGMLLRGNSLNASLLMMVLYLHQQDLVLRELLENITQCAQSLASLCVFPRPCTW